MSRSLPELRAELRAKHAEAAASLPFAPRSLAELVAVMVETLDAVVEATTPAPAPAPADAPVEG